MPDFDRIALSPPSDDEHWHDVRLLQPSRARAVPACLGPYRLAFPVHTGEAGGLIGGVLVMLVGFGLVMMIILGIRLWWLRRP